MSLNKFLKIIEGDLSEEFIIMMMGRSPDVKKLLNLGGKCFVQHQAAVLQRDFGPGFQRINAHFWIHVNYELLV